MIDHRQPPAEVRPRLWPVLVIALACSTARVATADDVEQAIADLASDQFSVRQRAAAQLETAGVSAASQIAAAAVGPDPEVRRRAGQILLNQVQAGDAKNRQVIRGALSQLAKAPSEAVARRSEMLLAQIDELAAGIAVAELTRLGATVMPVAAGPPLTFNVQVRQTWSGGDAQLSLLSQLGAVPWLSMENAPISDAGLAHLGHFAGRSPALSKLYLGGSRVTGRGLVQLAALVDLQYLSLKQLPIDSAALAQLPTLPRLTHLGLDGTKITDEGLKELARFPQLQVVWLDEAPISDAGLVHLKSLGQLRMLYLPKTKAAGPGLAALAELPNLHSLSLRGVRLGPESLKYVGQIEQLESLGLDQTNVADDELVHLSRLKRLRILWLSSTAVGDAGVEHLMGLQNLQILHLSEGQISGEAASRLQQALPNCQIAMSGRPETPPVLGRPEKPVIVP